MVASLKAAVSVKEPKQPQAVLADVPAAAEQALAVTKQVQANADEFKAVAA